MEEAESGGFRVGLSINTAKVAKVCKKLCDSRDPEGDKSAQSSPRL